MENSNTSKTEQVRRILMRKRVADQETLKRATDGRNRRSLFRDLAKLDHFSSYTHAGRFYTLPGIPEFDEHGLWFHKEIGFSQAGTLKDTVALLVKRSHAGYFHRELEGIVRVGVHNTLLDLCRSSLIQRQSLGPRRYLYLNADSEHAAQQLQQRKAILADGPIPQPPIHVGSIGAIIAILVETIHASKKLPSVAEVTRRLALRNVCVVADQVEQIWSHYGIHKQKKTVESKQKPSKN